MIRPLMILVLCVMLAALARADTTPAVEREFRAVWVATVDNIDFPTKKGLPVEQQRKELLDIVDLAKKLRLNCIIFQVRPMADAVYKPGLEPWSEFLTGQMGKPQEFDPLAFLIDEAHRRGILVHAWFNPYRAYHLSAKTMSDEHVSKKQPSIVRQYGRYMWLDPTDPAARKESIDVITDVVRRYDVDGVHFDDYFYPYAEKDAQGKTIDFPDDKNWNEYLKTAATGQFGKALSRDDWRRANVTSFIQAVAREVKHVKRDVVFGISPFGIWQPDPALGIDGFNSYKELYADSRKWLQDGTVDYLSPQLYWETARKGQSFPVLIDWWREQNVRHSYIWPGLAAYRIGSTPTFTADEIASQIEKTRASSETRGAIFFSEKSLRNDMGGIQAMLRDKVYKRDAVIPAFNWIAVEAIKPPIVTMRRAAKLVTVSWRQAGSRAAFWFVVYAKDKDGWSYSVVPASEHSMSLTADRKIEKVVVTAVDRLGNESEPPAVAGG
ncbi:MAG: family 10 glycosylhydrolase [Acidobacteria bacterium]|nr:family 10 glycosylhydrolase [Acidobacteriota bacterium]